MSRRKKRQKDSFTLEVKEPWNCQKGHNEHRSGSGEHQDRRVKRQRTRRDQLNAHLEEME